VINAIDAHLKSGPGLRVQYKLQDIHALEDLLNGARDAARAVLVIADHGHIPGGRLKYVGMGDGARYRELAEGEKPGEHEVVLDGKLVWRKKQRNRLALLYRETDSYVAGPHAGEHGGASLAEVVAPAILLGADDLAQRAAVDLHDDPALQIVALPKPAWWDLVLPSTPPTVEPVARLEPPRIKPEKTAQLAMPFVAPRDAAPAAIPSSGAPSRWRKLLTEHPVFKERTKRDLEILEKQVVPQVELLVELGPRMAADFFANRAGIPVFRVPGAVAVLSEWLNLDGYPVVLFDKTSKEVCLNREFLLQLFGGGE
jgi:hypothetical protein